MIDRPLGATRLARLLSIAYRGIVDVRNALYDRFPRLSVQAPMPVVSVGGIHAGGSGKTPLVSLIVRQFLERGVRVALVSRGYARRLRGPVVVAPGEPAAWESVGDEPAMLRRELPDLWLAIGPNRHSTACMAARRMVIGPTTPVVAVLDDGFQHRRLRRNLDIVCLPADFRNGWLLPAGYLREPLESLRRADAGCIIGEDSDVETMQEDALWVARRFGVRETFVLVQRTGEWVEVATGRRCTTLGLTRPALVCGIARPERFVRAVRRLDIEPVRTLIFPDHHRYSAADLSGALAAPADGLVTTAKDAVRMMSLQLAKRQSIWYLTVGLCFADSGQEDRFRAMVHARTHA